MTKSQVAPFRVRLIFSLFVLFALVLVAKLYFLQIVSGDEYSTQADRQSLSPSTKTFERGSIFFTGKDGELITGAVQTRGFLVALNPSVLEDAEMAYEKIKNILEFDHDTFFAKASKKQDPYEEIAKKVSVPIGEAINELGVPGLGAFEEKWRSYPNEKLAAHTLGLMAFKEDELAGRYGLERVYENVLKRSGGESLYTNFFVETFLNIKKTVEGNGGSGDIVTSIEPSVQAFLEQEIERVNNKWSSDYSGGIVIDPKTGEIVALALHPDFNPNFFQAADPSTFSNRLVESVYEMGSIIKPLTMAAALDSGAVTAKTTYNDLGTLTLDNYQIYNYDKKARGVVDMQQVLNQSLNTGVTFAAMKMGNDTFSRYMKGFGLAEKTGIDLPYEAAPLVSNLESKRQIELATASYGQGIAMTPISTVRALSVLANGGVLVNPHVVKQIKYKTGLSKNLDGSAGTAAVEGFGGTAGGRRVLKKATSDEISRMLVNVVDEALLGGTVKQEHYSIAAKTGTAQVALEGSRGYYDDRFLHSFFGYFPAYDARFLVFLYTYHPKGVQYASETLTHSFIDITKYLINYYEIEPDR